MVIVSFLSMFQGVIFNGIAEFVRWSIIWMVPLLSLNSTLKKLKKTIANQYDDNKSQVKHWCV